MFLINTYQRFLKFLKRPDQGSYRRMGSKFKIRTFFSLLLLNTIFAIVWLSCYYLFFPDAWDKARSLPFLNNFWMILLVVVLLAPLLEEVVFRLPMKYNRNYLLRFFVYLVEIFLFDDEEKEEKLQHNVHHLSSQAG